MGAPSWERRPGAAVRLDSRCALMENLGFFARHKKKTRRASMLNKLGGLCGVRL
jgi:hypothetical protein